MVCTDSKKINIAIDGYSGCGKSTLAKDLAKCLNYIYLDSGSMYRAVTLYFQQAGLDYNVEDQLLTGLQQIKISFNPSKDQAVLLLNGKDVEKEIRSFKVSSEVSQIARISAIRRFLVQKQQFIAREKGVIMEGRDIGTVVMPQAEYKLFLTADTETRVARRYNQLRQKSQHVDMDDIRNNLIERDRIDSTREDSPLKKAEDAVVMDNTSMNRHQQLDKVIEDLKAKFPFIKVADCCSEAKKNNTGLNE